MYLLQKSLLIVLLPLMAMATVHKFYLSVTNVGHSEKDSALQIVTRTFIDDTNTVLLERYGIQAQLGTDQESEQDVAYLEQYVRSRFVVEVNGEPLPYAILGKKYDADMLILFIEVPNVVLGQVRSIGLTNEILTDMFPDQQNVVHLNIGNKKKSFVLMRNNIKGMLNLKQAE
ncbi:DUF6702 family protein [Maribacter sp. 2307ULW6-5]|uniref:DUF6702 family protein n=1 Tax=Maribacter sp. 2307ULW6-5 TaxID=3386275 RepID=UPI0039BD642B